MGKHIKDFTFGVNLNDLDYLPPEELARIGPVNLSMVDVKGVASVMESYANAENVESKGIKAHFNLDDSGILTVTGVEAVFEKTIPPEEEKPAETPTSDAKDGKEESNWLKLGDTLKGLFGDDKDTKEGDESKVPSGDDSSINPKKKKTEIKRKSK